jgi:KDO2-lipid IV(A) lauroyltransferase
MAARGRSPLRDWTEYLLVRVLLGTLRRSPRAVACRLARLYVGILDAAIPRYRRVALRNLVMAMPEAGPAERSRIVDGVFRSIGRLLVAFSRMPDLGRENIREWIEHDGFENYLAAKRRGRGVLIATGHLGNWELSAAGHALLCGDTVDAVVRPLDNPLLDKLVRAARETGGNRMVGKKDFLRVMLTTLRANGTAAVFVDQNSTMEQDVFVDFFGIPARTGATFAKLAAHTGAAVLPGFAVWVESERRYRLKFYPPLDLTGEVLEDTRRVQAAVERAVREHPDQWLWIHRRWKTRQPGEPELY